MIFSRVEEETNAAYPGLALAVTSGRRPIIVRRVNYFDDRSFVRTFDPHPDHGFKPISNQIVPVIAPPVVEEDSKDIVDQLISFYGIKNFEKAISIHKNLGYAYPNCALARKTQVAFAKEVLDRGRWNSEFCAKWGEKRTIDEFIDFLLDHKSLGILSKRSDFNFCFAMPRVQNIFELLEREKSGRRLSFMDQIQLYSLSRGSAVNTYLIVPFFIGGSIAVLAGVVGPNLAELPSQKLAYIRTFYVLLVIISYFAIVKYFGKKFKSVAVLTFLISCVFSLGLIAKVIEKWSP